MVAFVRGDVIVIPFPFSYLSINKRPALIVATLTGFNVIVCPITSQNRTGNKYAIELITSDIQNGRLRQETSYVQTGIVFTAKSTLISYKVGEVSSQKLQEITEMLIRIFEGKI